MIRFLCPECGKHLKAPVSFIGKQVKCSRCGRTLQAPGVSDPKAPSPVRTPRLGGLFGGFRALWPRGRWLLLLGGLIAGGLLALGVVYLLMPGTVDQELMDLKGGAPEKSRQALEGLAAAQVQDSERARVTAALEPLLIDSDLHGGLDPDLVLRTYLAWAGKDNVPALIRLMQTPAPPRWNPNKTGLVMEALGKTQDQRAAEALAALLPDPVLHDQAVNALEVMGKKAQTAVVAYLFDDNPDTRLRASRLLADIGAKPGTVADAALSRLRSNQADVRRGAVVWFVDNAPGAAARKDDAAQALANLLDDPSPEVRNQALQALRAWATKDCLPQLLAYAQREQKNPSGGTALIDVLAQFPDETAAEAVALLLTNAQMRDKAAQALLQFGPAATKAVVPYINHPDPGVKKAARELCRRLNVPADLLLDQTLADAAAASIPRGRAALQHLAALRPDDSNRAKVSEALNPLLLDPHPEIRTDALNAVKVWGTQANTAALLKLLGDYQGGKKENDACGVIDLLGSLKDPKAAPALAQALTVVRERGPASVALVSIGPAAEEAVLPFLQAADPGARIAACWVLADIGTAKSLQPLQDAISFAPGGALGEPLIRAAQEAILKISARK